MGDLLPPMKRLLLTVVLAALTALALFYALRHSRKASPSAAFAMVPGGAAAVVVVPDVRKARVAMHDLDIYKLWHEPALQEFLRKPLAGNPGQSRASHVIQDLDDLGATDLFAAAIPDASSTPKIIGGFAFSARQSDAERIVEGWRATMHGGETVPRETTEHRGHQIVTDAAGSSAFAGGWFVMANDLDALKRLLDRVDAGATDTGATLLGDATFVGARTHMPQRYNAIVYTRPDLIGELLTRVNPALAARTGAMQKLRCVMIAEAFDGGQIRETVFAGAPQPAGGQLTRSALALGTADTIFYGDWLIDLEGMMGAAAAGQAAGISAQHATEAFGNELAVVADWPKDSRWPVAVATLPVKDGAKARAVATEIARGTADVREKNGSQFFTFRAPGQMFAITPTLAISDRAAVAGFGADSVETVLGRAAANAAGLAAVENFKRAQSAVPAGKTGFMFLDTALFYTRLDAALRPMLMMGAAFVPSIAEAVDLRKLPDPALVAKHLTPLVMSQRYEGDGYVLESVGPLGFTHVAGLGAAIGSGAAMFYQHAAGLPAMRLLPGQGVPQAQPTPDSTP